MIEFYTYIFAKGVFEKSEINVKLEEGEVVTNLIAVDLDNNKALDLIITVKVREIEKHIFYIGKLKQDTEKSSELLEKFERNIFEIVNEGILLSDIEGDNFKRIIYYNDKEKERVYAKFDESKNSFVE